jgi:pilus assembly protein Flp/PilA
MRGITTKIVRFLLAEDGPTAVEYAVLVLLVVLACLTAITIFGQSTANNFQGSYDAIETVTTPGP